MLRSSYVCAQDMCTRDLEAQIYTYWALWRTCGSWVRQMDVRKSSRSRSKSPRAFTCFPNGESLPTANYSETTTTCEQLLAHLSHTKVHSNKPGPTAKVTHGQVSNTWLLIPGNTGDQHITTIGPQLQTLHSNRTHFGALTKPTTTSSHHTTVHHHPS